MYRLLLSLFFIYFTSSTWVDPLSSAEVITLHHNECPCSVIVPRGHRISPTMQQHLAQLQDGCFNQLHISYAGPLKSEEHFKLVIQQLEETIGTKVHITDPAIRNGEEWCLKKNLYEAAQALSKDNAILITPIGDSILFHEYEEQQILRVTALELLSCLTGKAQGHQSTNNLENITGGIPQGGRLVAPILIGTDYFYVFLPTERVFYSDTENSSEPKENLLDLYHILFGTTVDPFASEEAYQALPSSHARLFDQMMEAFHL